VDFGIAGVQPEPRAGYRVTAVRNRQLQAFSDAVWQRHQATHAQGGPIGHWPASTTFHTNWPLLAWHLIEASWWIAGAEGDGGSDVADTDDLDPLPPPERDWHETYAAELLRKPAILRDLDSDLNSGRVGDGIERVLERAQLSSGERAVIRPFLYGTEVSLIAEDLGWQRLTVGNLLRNALDRLKFLGYDSRHSTTSGDRDLVGSDSTKPGRTSRADVRQAIAAGGRA
jgi:hypothetical protein